MVVLEAHWSGEMPVPMDSWVVGIIFTEEGEK